MKEKKRSETNKYRSDILFISAMILLSVVILLTVYFTKEEGSFVIVEIDGVISGEYPLSKDGVFPLNNGTNVLVIEDGAAYLNFSSCPDHTCEKTGKIQYAGQTIVCLPNRLSVTIEGESDNSVDLVS